MALHEVPNRGIMDAPLSIAFVGGYSCIHASSSVFYVFVIIYGILSVNIFTKLSKS